MEYKKDKLIAMKETIAKKMKPKIKSEGKPFKFYKQKGREGTVHVGAFKEK